LRFQDVIKDSVRDTLHAGNLFISDIVITLLCACLLGAYLYLLYRLTSKNEFYNRDFNKALALLPMITASILLAMQANLLVSLGMVGALSIVRFRTAIKNPIDLTYLFFAISSGIIVGTGVYKLALLSAVFFTAMCFLLDLFPTFHAPHLLVVSFCDASVHQEIVSVMKKHCRSVRMRNQSITTQGIEMIWEIRIRRDFEFLQQISQITGVTSANLLSHDGELRV